MSYAGGMPVDRLSITVPAELGAALRALAEERGEPMSSVVAEAIARYMRTAALDRLLHDMDREFGPVPERLLAEAEAELTRATSRAKKASRKRRKRSAA